MPRSSKKDSTYPRYDKELNLVIRQTYEKVHIVFLVLKNTQIEVQQLRKEQTTLLNALKKILAIEKEDPALALRCRKEMLEQMNHNYEHPRD